jgi:hypothetical protein
MLSKDVSPLALRDANGALLNTNKEAIVTPTGSTNTLMFFDSVSSISSAVNISNVFVNIIDLTACGFTSAETTNVATLKTAWLKKYGTPIPLYIPYDNGSLKNTDGKYLLHGRNLWDEEWESGVYSITVGTPLVKGTNTNYIRSKNTIKVQPNTEYYFKGVSQYDCVIQVDENDIVTRVNYTNTSGYTIITTQEQTSKIVFYAYGNTYNHNICFNPSDASINGTYFPYYNGGEIDCSGAPLNGIDDTVCDVKDFATGKRTNKTVLVDMGLLTWMRNTYGGVNYFAATIENAIANVPVTSTKKPVCGVLVPTTPAYIVTLIDGTICYKTDSRGVYARADSYTTVDSFLAFVSGKGLLVELATPVITNEPPYPLDAQLGYNCLEPISGGVQSANVSVKYVETVEGYINELVGA